METTKETASRHPEKARARSTPNAHDTRESWLRSAMAMLEPMFAQAGHPLPDTRRAAIGFTSKGGGKSNCLGECWHSTASSDGHFEIFIRPDKADPLEVLGILAHELVHAAVPLGSGHGPVYKELALKIGLEGKMRHAMPGMHLTEKLQAVAADLGPLPHAALDITFRESAPRKKQKTNMLKAFCEGGPNAEGEPEGCDYIVRLTKTHAERGAPFCGIHNVRMKIEWPEDEEATEPEADAEAEPETLSPPDLEGSSDARSAPIYEDAKVSFKASHPSPDGDDPSSSIVPDDAEHDPFPKPLRKRTPEPVAEPSPSYRWTEPNEVHQPGYAYRINPNGDRTEVSLAPLGETAGKGNEPAASSSV